MNIRKAAKVIDTSSRYPGRPTLTPFVATKITDDPNYTARDDRKGYELRALLGCSFICNTAQYDHALANAYRQLQHELYRDQIIYVDRIRAAVHAGFDDEAMKLLAELYDSMTKPD